MSQQMTDMAATTKYQIDASGKPIAIGAAYRHRTWFRCIPSYTAVTAVSITRAGRIRCRTSAGTTIVVAAGNLIR